MADVCVMKGSEWLVRFIHANGINARLIKTGKVSTVKEAAEEIGCKKDQIIKSIVFISKKGNAVVAIVDGVSRVDTAKVEKTLREKVRIAERNEVEKLTGFPAGGVPPIGHGCLTLIDLRVFKNSTVYGGGGDEYHLIEISPDEIVRANSGYVSIGDIHL